MKLFYVVNARMPTEKAHGIQIAKMCEAFINLGIDVTVVVPTRRKRSKSMKDFYDLSVDVPLVRLPAIDWFETGNLGFALASATFMITYSLYIFFVTFGRDAVLYTIDMDTFSSAALVALGKSVFTEMHGVKRSTWLSKFFFRHLKGVISINTLVSEKLKETFSLPEKKLLIESNGVDLTRFGSRETREEARKKLGLSSDMSIAVYSGRFYAWKELGILAEVASHMPSSSSIYVVGGTRDAYEILTNTTAPEQLIFAGEVPSYEMPTWLYAADALLVLGSRSNEESYKYTSPMKAFEYMAANRPIVASDTPALRCIFADDEVYFYKPDDAPSLAAAIRDAFKDGGIRASKARESVIEHTWKARAQRILDFMLLRSN